VLDLPRHVGVSHPHRGGCHRWRSGSWLLPALLIILAGCSQTKRHRMLTLLFDGVPPLEQVSADSVVTTPESPRQRKPRVPTMAVYYHVPFERGECSVCHDLPRSDKRTFFLNARLVATVAELCTSCHAEQEAATLRIENAWVHGPVAAGQCTGCHSPHRSLYPHLLIRPPGGPLCGRCHAEETLSNRQEHLGELATLDCGSCHSSHAGDGCASPLPPCPDTEQDSLELSDSPGNSDV
jgi:predicted CXXCH cytochrome family protein